MKTASGLSLSSRQHLITPWIHSSPGSSAQQSTSKTSVPGHTSLMSVTPDKKRPDSTQSSCLHSGAKSPCRSI
ncbi:unnamed protein product [Boreogadus saida]